MRLSSLNFLALGAAVALFCGNASAQHEHSDVEFGYAGGMIDIEFGDEGHVFEADFGDLELGPDATEEPGFGSELDEDLGIDPNDIIAYNVLGPLLYHDGAGFAPTTATLTIENLTSSTRMVDSATTSASDFINQADAAGDFHSHLDFAISASAPVGAYGLKLSLSAFDEHGVPKTGVADSDPFYVVFNRGLEESVFEGAVGAFAAEVPEPASLAFAGLALAAAAARRRVG